MIPRYGLSAWYQYASVVTPPSSRVSLAGMTERITGRQFHSAEGVDD
jgi:hypothetical protein